MPRNKITILHTNDIHGHVEDLARIGTLVSQIRTVNEVGSVLYLDAGDSEEYANRLSSLTKGCAMHRLLAAAGCNATAIGNAILSRYGPKAVTDETTVTIYPHLAANICYSDGRMIPGTKPSVILEVSGIRLGVIGLTPDSNENNSNERFFDLRMLPAIPAIREQIAILREAGADAVILLSHMGLKADRELAADLQDELSLIIGGHSHDLLREGEWVRNVLIAQAGNHAQHLGLVELEWDGKHLLPITAAVIPVIESIPPALQVLSMVDNIEEEIQNHLGEVICQLSDTLDYAIDRECGIGNLLADALRHRAQAEVAVAVPGTQFIDGLPAGPLQRETLWSICPSTANPGFTIMTGAQLSALIKRGLDPAFAREIHEAMRGHARGLIHISGAQVRKGQLTIQDQPVETERSYLVAASDFEFEPLWGYTEEAWQLNPQYEVDVILREVLDDYLRTRATITVEMGRFDQGAIP